MSNWIKALAEEAKKENWCVRIGCTTCGSSKFRSRLIIDSCMPSEIDIKKIRSFLSNKKYIILSDLDDKNKKICVVEISRTLALLNIHEASYLEAIIRVIFYEIYINNFIDLAKDLTLATPAGDVLKSMETHSKHVDELRRKHAIENSPDVVAEKKKIKKELKAKAHAERVEKYKLLGKSKKNRD